MTQVLKKHPNKLATFILIVALSIVYWRLLPTLPTVMQDELVYMIQARHTDPSESQFPNYLFSLIFSSSGLFGPEYYWYVKLLNFVFLLIFASVIFQLSREVFGFWVALLFAVASSAGPISLYGSIFMPEAMYMAFASLAFYSVLRVPVGGIRSSWKSLLQASFILSLTTLVKPHALILLFGFLLYFLLSSTWRATHLFTRLKIGASFAISTLGMKLLGGLVLAGPSGVTLFGGYGSVGGVFERLLSLQQSASDADEETPIEPSPIDTPQIEGSSGGFQFLEFTVQQFGLHFMALGFLLAPAWYVFFATRFSVSSAVSELALFSLATMMIVISAFGAYVTVTGDDHSDRILLRYYEFLIPIVLLGALKVLQKTKPTGILKFVLFGVFATSTLLIASNGIGDADMKLSDSSYLLGIFDNLDLLWLYSAAVIASLLFILASPTRAADYVAITLIVATLFAGYSSQQRQLDQNSLPIGSDFAGQYVRDNLPNIEGEKILVLGSDKQLVEATVFWMDKSGVTYKLFKPGSRIPDSEIPPDKTVIVQVLGVQIESLSSDDIRGNDFIISFRDVN